MIREFFNQFFSSDSDINAWLLLFPLYLTIAVLRKEIERRGRSGVGSCLWGRPGPHKTEVLWAHIDL